MKKRFIYYGVILLALALSSCNNVTISDSRPFVIREVKANKTSNGEGYYTYISGHNRYKQTIFSDMKFNIGDTIWVTNKNPNRKRPLSLRDLTRDMFN